MRGTLTSFLAWGRLTFGSRGFAILLATFTFGGSVALFACGDTGPSEIGNHPEDQDSGASDDSSGGDGDAAAEAGEEETDGGDTDDAGDAGDADVKDAGEDADAAQ